MNKFVTPVLVLMLAGFCFASSCKPDKPEDPVTITYELGEVKDYMYFKPGSWWVYEHDLTHERDSQYVTQCVLGPTTKKGTEDWSKHITLVQETLFMRIRSNFKDGWGSTNYFDIYTNGQNVNAYPYPRRAYQYTRNKISSNNSNSSTIVFYHPFDLCKNKQQCLYYLDTTLTSFQLNSFTFDTVRVFSVTYGDAVMQTPYVPVHKTSAKCYYAKGYGLVKVSQNTFKVSDGSPYIHSWNIIKMNIIK